MLYWFNELCVLSIVLSLQSFFALISEVVIKILKKRVICNETYDNTKLHYHILRLKCQMSINFNI